MSVSGRIGVAALAGFFLVHGAWAANYKLGIEPSYPPDQRVGR